MSNNNSDVPTELVGSGWFWLHNAPKWHYFLANGNSLCGRWMTFGRAFEQGNDGSPDNCAACRKKLEKIKAKTALPETQPETPSQSTGDRTS